MPYKHTIIMYTRTYYKIFFFFFQRDYMRCLCHHRFLIASHPSASESQGCLVSEIQSNCTEPIPMSIENKNVYQECKIIEVNCY